MASIYDLKPKFQALLRPLNRFLKDAGITANQVTIGAFLMSAVMGAGLYLTAGAPVLLFLLPVVLFIRMGLNAIDGMLAREHDQKSKLGAMLNELTDVLGDAVLYLPFAVIVGGSGILPGTLIVLIVLLGIVAEFAGVAAIQIGAPRGYQGPFGKSDRAFFFGLLGVLLGFGFLPSTVLLLFLWIGVILGGVTIINRVRAALQDGQS